ncbi:MAG: RsmD family RNA methyltransferase [Opitutales bacterium]
MRITGGGASGIPLKVPTGSHVRPATDFMREAVFSSLGKLVEGATVLDLFAGIGGYGLEALSRGARLVTFVEKNVTALRLLETNIGATQKALGREAEDPSTQLARKDVFKWKGPWGSFNLVFADPPYPLWLGQPKAILVRGQDYLIEADASARLVCEAPGGFDLIAPKGLRIVKKIERGPQQPAVTIFAPTAD